MTPWVKPSAMPATLTSGPVVTERTPSICWRRRIAAMTPSTSAGVAAGLMASRTTCVSSATSGTVGGHRSILAARSARRHPFDPDSRPKAVLRAGNSPTMTVVLVDPDARQQSDRHVEAMLAVSRAVADGRPLRTVLNQVARQAARVVGAKTASILLLHDTGRLRLAGSFGLSQGYNKLLAQAEPLALGRGPSGLAVQTG